MSCKKFSQDEVNRIVTVRVKRERERLAKEFENRMKRCMASLHLMLHQEMREMKQDTMAETQEPSLPAIEPGGEPALSGPIKSIGGERQ